MENEREATESIDIDTFAKRFTEQLSKHFGHRVEKWMLDIASDAYDMWLEDDPKNQTPEDMADEEAGEVRRNG